MTIKDGGKDQFSLLNCGYIAMKRPKRMNKQHFNTSSVLVLSVISWQVVYKIYFKKEIGH